MLFVVYELKVTLIVQKSGNVCYPRSFLLSLIVVCKHEIPDNFDFFLRFFPFGHQILHDDVRVDFLSTFRGTTIKQALSGLLT